MTNQNVINFLNQVRKVLLDDKSWLKSTIQPINEAFDKAISALQEQDSKTKRCATCKHNHPSKKWPCVDCDMRELADRWEPKEVKNSTQEVKNSKKSSLTQKGLDTISRRKAINTVKKHYRVDNDLLEVIVYQLENLPPAQPDCIECLRKIDDYGEEHYIGDDDKMFWDIRSILENPKHSEANHYGESTEIVRGKENR